jgi:hydrogenase-4 component B
MTHIGTAFIIGAFVLIYKYTGSVYFSSINLHDIPTSVKNMIFIFCIMGFGTKAGLIPLHIWLPQAYPAAPSNISALMSGAMSKTAVYGIIRFIIGFSEVSFLWWGVIVLLIGAISTILGITLALMENNMKKLLAYSSVENMGIIIMGLGLCICAYASGNPALAAFSLSAALFHTLNHSLFKGLLFLGAGAVHYSTNTKNIEKLGGLIKRMPYTAFFFLTGTLAISAIPPFNGFTSEWFVYQSIFASIGVSDSWLKIILILSVALLGMAGVIAATTFIKAFGISFLALPRTDSAKSAKEVPKSMLLGMGILSSLCLIIGILPLIILKTIDRVTLQLLNTSVLGDLKGLSSFITFSAGNSSSISIMALAISVLILLPLIILFVRRLSLNTKTRVYGTWDCGYKELNSRMQYSATGFSKPLRIVLRAIYKPKRELEVESSESPYFFKNARYVVSTQSFFEIYLYEPIIKNILNFARRTRFLVQTGSIHTYLIYIFIVIITMFFYYAKS